jgi:hypothetical protein
MNIQKYLGSCCPDRPSGPEKYAPPWGLRTLFRRRMWPVNFEKSDVSIFSIANPAIGNDLQIAKIP